MIPERIVEAAVRGGWDGEWDNVLGPIEHRETGNAWDRKPVVLSASFWQSLGRALGWFGDESPLHRCEKAPGVWADPMWIINAKIFYDLILTQASQEQLDAFWEELLPNK